MSVLGSPSLRRIMAAFLTVALLFSIGEEVIADVHDGGATHAEVDRATGISHAPDDGAAAGPAHVLQQESAPAESDHTVHVCHCSHVHGAVVTLAAATPRLSFFRFAAPFAMSAAPLAAVVLDRTTRPPIA